MCTHYLYTVGFETNQYLKEKIEMKLGFNLWTH